MRLAEIYQDGVHFELKQEDGYKIYEDGRFTGHRITAPNVEIAEGYFEDYVARVR